MALRDLKNGVRHLLCDAPSGPFRQKVPDTVFSSLLDRVKAINEFRNTRVAHQETPLTSPAEAKSALQTWVDGLGLLWRAAKG